MVYDSPITFAVADEPVADEQDASLILVAGEGNNPPWISFTDNFSQLSDVMPDDSQTSSVTCNVTIYDSPTVGGWTSAFTAAKQMADEQGIPLVLVATSTGCTTCNNFNADVFTKHDFQDWCASKPYLFCWVKANLGNWTSGEQKAILDFVGGGGLPRFSVYWNRRAYDGGAAIGAKDLTIAAQGHAAAFYEAYVEKYVGGYSRFSDRTNCTKFYCQEHTDPSYMPTAKFLQPGLWTADLTGAQEYAARHHGFYVVMMTNPWGGCGFCNSLDQTLYGTAAFQEFFRENKIPLVICDSTYSPLTIDRPGQAQEVKDHYADCLPELAKGDALFATLMKCTGDYAIPCQAILKNEGTGDCKKQRAVWVGYLWTSMWYRSGKNCSDDGLGYGFKQSDFMLNTNGHVKDFADGYVSDWLLPLMWFYDRPVANLECRYSFSNSKFEDKAGYSLFCNEVRTVRADGSENFLLDGTSIQVSLSQISKLRKVSADRIFNDNEGCQFHWVKVEGVADGRVYEISFPKLEDSEGVLRACVFEDDSDFTDISYSYDKIVAAADYAFEVKAGAPCRFRHQKPADGEDAFWICFTRMPFSLSEPNDLRVRFTYVVRDAEAEDPSPDASKDEDKDDVDIELKDDPDNSDEKDQYETPKFHLEKNNRVSKAQVFSAQEFPLHHTYTSTGKKITKISDNVSALTLIGQTTQASRKNFATSQLTDASFSPSISEVTPSCFIGCANLSSVNASNNIKSVGDYAFYGCTSLTGISFLESGNKVLKRIGQYAFANSGLRSIKVNLQGSVSESSINSHAFAGCKQLTSAELLNSTYLADHMFDGCEKLAQVKLNDYHSYVNPYAFANCTSLQHISIPANTYMLSPHMFDGCTNLTEVEFKTPSHLRQLEESVFANCPKLTSLILPDSVDDLEYIDQCFLSGSSIDRLVFKGLKDEVFINKSYKKIEISYEPAKWYSSDALAIKNLLNACHNYHLPMIINLGNHRNYCGNCKTWEDRVLKDPLWEPWFSKSKYFYLHGMYDADNNAYKTIKNFIISKTDLQTPGAFPYIYIYWNKLNADGTSTIIADGGSGLKSGPAKFNTAKGLQALADESFKGYAGLSSCTEEINLQLSTFGRGAKKSVVFVSSTGKEYKCSNDSIDYSPETKVDKSTTSDFKFGTWYGNARELVAAADSAHVPVLAEFGSVGCDPCVNFRKKTFNNPDFQTAISSLPVLLCKVEIGDGESFDYPTTSQAYWISHQFGNPKTYIPQLVFYWNPPSSIGNGKAYKEIWNYNYRSDPANANYQTVLAKVDKMLDNFSGGKAWLASISSDFRGKAIYDGPNDMYQYYENVVGDDDGRYFICDSKTRIGSWTETVLSVKTREALIPCIPVSENEDPFLSAFEDSANSLAPASYENVGGYSVFSSLKVNDIVELDDATYQYFTAPVNQPLWNISGLIFKVSQMSAVGGRAVAYADDKWIFKDTSQIVDSSSTSSIALSSGVEYMYRFDNVDDDIPPDDPKYDEVKLGTWISADSSTSENAFSTIENWCEIHSVVLVILEEQSTYAANVVLESGSSVQVQVDLTTIQNEAQLTKLVQSKLNADQKLKEISNKDFLMTAINFTKNVKLNAAFKSWMSSSGHCFLNVKTDTWTSGFPSALRRFEREARFDGNTPDDSLPKILVYHGCSGCVVSGVAVYCRKKIEIAGDHDQAYYSGLIKTYAALLDDYIWVR